jgi:glycosyltransferase involved in cell wall biosynthesis
LAPEKVKERSPRPVLIASEHAIREYATYIERLLVGFADESVPAVLVCPPGADVDPIISGAVEVVRHPVIELPLTEPLNTRMLVDRLAKFQPTVVHCLCESRASMTRQVARRLDAPYVLAVNSLQGGWGRLSVSSRRCARIIVPAESIASNIAGIWPGFAERIVRINVGAFVADTVCFGDPGHTPVMLVAHPFDNADDFENLLAAARHLILESYEFMMLVIGEGRAERQLRKLISALDLGRLVTVVPRLRPWRSVLAAGDIFIQPQPSSAFNPSLLEAMSTGAAVAACKGGVDDLIIEDETAVVFDPDDELSVMAALQRLLGRREFARKIARAAQNHLRENHSVSKMISATLQAYRRAESWIEHL